MPTAKKKTAMKKRTPVAARTAAVKAVKKQPVAKKVPTVAVPVQKRSLHLPMHFAIATSAIFVLMLLGFVDRATFSTLPGKAADMMPATIGVEHDGPLTLSVLVARKEQAGYVSLANQSNADIHVSVPSSWKRSEVTGAPLAQVTSDIPVFGFTRWNLPAHAGIKMLLSEAPTSLFFDSTSTTSAEIDLQTIDLTNLHASSNVVLLQSQVLVPLWGNDQQ